MQFETGVKGKLFLIHSDRRQFINRAKNSRIYKLRIKRLMKRWKHSGGNVIQSGQVKNRIIPNVYIICCVKNRDLSTIQLA